MSGVVVITPLTPAQAGVQGNLHGLDFVTLGPRLRGDERRKVAPTSYSAPSFTRRPANNAKGGIR